MDKIRCTTIFAAIVIISACTNFREDEIPVSFGVDVDALNFTSASSTRAVTVSSGTKWDVINMPEWISLKAITRSGLSPYKWIVDFSASANDEYNREGIITIESKTEAAEVSVTQDGKKGKFIVVESVSVSPTELTMTEGDKSSLSIIIIPSNASIKDVSWKSSNTSIATVSQSGEVTAVAEGTTTITVTTIDGNKTASCLVTVQAKVIPVTGVSLDNTSLSMVEGDVKELIATVTPSNATDKTVTWSSNNTSVATVSSSGVITAKAAGTTTIIVTTNDGGKKAACSVTVQAKKVSVTGVSLDKTTLSMVEGDTQPLTATVTPSNATDKSVSWSSNNTSVATVSSSGVVTAKAVGTAKITVTTNDGGKTAICSVTVSAATVSVTGVSLNKTSMSMTVGDTQTLTATITPSNATDKSVTWSSSNNSVATVSSSGVVTAKSVGEATITVTTNDGSKTAQCAVTVQAPIISVTGVSLDKTSLSMIVGDTQFLTAYVVPENATDKSVIWSSSNTNVATVTSSGLVTAKMVGTAVITVSTKDGAKTATCSVSVGYAIPVAVDLGLSVKWASFNVGATKPEDSGYFFPWGYTEPVAYNYGDFFFFTLDAYKWYNSSDRTLTKYCPIANYGHNGYTDNKSLLDQSDDAAYVILGASWRMPTNEEFTQLKERCTWKWTSTNGVNGYTVTGPNGNSIFLPAAGFGTMMEFRNGGTQGYYWSTSLRTDYPYYAYSFSFGASSYDNESRDRSSILPIRPVSGAQSVSVTGVSLNKTSLSMTVGDTQTLTATVTPSNATDKSVTWSSSNTSVAVVSSSGVVTAKAAGSTTITVTTSDGGKKATCTVTVKAQTVSVTGVSLNKTSLSMTVGDTQTLTATVTPSNATDKSVTWSSSNTSVAVVSSSGVVTAKGAGTATITVTTNDGGKKATCSVTVQAQTISVTGVTLDKSSLSMTVGDTQTLTATVSPSNATDKSVTWSSSKTSVATVASSGVVTAKGAGTATITVTTNDGGKTATCTVNVQNATITVSSIEFDKSSIIMTKGGQTSISATVYPSNATDKSLTWKSSNTSIASVNQNGVVTAIGIGDVTITATSNDSGVSASCSVSVRNLDFYRASKEYANTSDSLPESGIYDCTLDEEVYRFRIVDLTTFTTYNDKDVSHFSVSIISSSSSGVVEVEKALMSFYYGQCVISVYFKKVGTATVKLTYNNNDGASVTKTIGFNIKKAPDGYNYPNNSVHGAFSVSNTKKVCFARANVTKDGSLLDYQYSVRSSSYNGNDATDGYVDLAEYDVSQIIKSSSDLGESWRLLSKEEWTYLTDERKNSDKKYYVRISDRGGWGMLLAPDDWEAPNDFSYEPWNAVTGGVYSIPYEEFMAFEEMGFIFLPQVQAIIAQPYGTGYRYSATDSGDSCRYALSDPITVTTGSWNRKVYFGYRLNVSNMTIVYDHYDYNYSVASYGTMFSAVRAAYDL